MRSCQNNSFNLSHKNCLFFDTDNTHCLDIYYHLKVPKVLTQYTPFKDTLLQFELHVKSLPSVLINAHLV